MKPQLLLALLSICLLAARPARAQQPARAAFGSDEAAARHKAAFAAAVHKAGLQRPADGYYKARIDVTKEAEFRRVGINLRELERRIRIDGPAPYEESSLFADQVVHGTVLSLVTDSSRSVCYHSYYKIRVAETWQGRPAETVAVRLITGPIGNTLGITFSGAPRLAVGQELILHLRYVDFTVDEETQKLGSPFGTNNATPGDFLVMLASPVRGDGVLSGYDQRTITPLADLRRNLKAIAAILDKEHFYQKAF
ncbi:hypothetical protein MUN81_20120 [Hymenobacter sp. 5317J-9]|uniref:hypothetical protein n=1 Tax=Hymenobacter sp. 5317J-9 TaxID=2932250 RepID=UPI001FD67573|nr:hypothetical protein [Hymenobacter sp. 5317J-9]UOQ97525.1 hypothetical protein MUN81_20120 [Hymenobacter sp. 5317J-9]